MNMLEFVKTNLDEHKDIVREYTTQYLKWVQDNVLEHYQIDMFKEIGIPIEKYVNNFIEKKAFTSEYSFFLIHHITDDKYIGMGAIRKHTESVGEIKRMYLEDEYHGEGYGLQLLKFLLDTAKTQGYEKVRLDTLKFMDKAQRIYDYVGFKEIPPYEESEVPTKLCQIMKYYEINTNILL
ncbi:MAG: GNAT family N-acetyltransferase [Candidatus Lokiarchaeota archaeon]|nr:GNAT family N-acetyltransferase [Candidatus Lokiarchaeota archaeon]